MISTPRFLASIFFVIGVSSATQAAAPTVVIQDSEGTFQNYNSPGDPTGTEHPVAQEAKPQEQNVSVQAFQEKIDKEFVKPAQALSKKDNLADNIKEGRDLVIPEKDQYKLFVLRVLYENNEKNQSYKEVKVIADKAKKRAMDLLDTAKKLKTKGDIDEKSYIQARDAANEVLQWLTIPKPELQGNPKWISIIKDKENPDNDVLGLIYFMTKEKKSSEEDRKNSSKKEDKQKFFWITLHPKWISDRTHILQISYEVMISPQGFHQQQGDIRRGGDVYDGTGSWWKENEAHVWEDLLKSE